MRTLLLAILAMAFFMPAHAEMSRQDAVALLDKSVVELRMGTTRFCTASKIGDREYLTARHCAQGLSDRFEMKQGYEYQWPHSVRMALDKGDDWAVLLTGTDAPEIGSLELSCDEEIYVGMPVAYMGYPDPVEKAFSAGYVSSDGKTTNRKMNSDFVIDVQASHGASGAPILSLDTGKVVGVLIEGVRGGAGFFMVGVQAVRDTPLCPKPGS